MADGRKRYSFAFIFPMQSGHLNPSLPIARALVSQGHAVHYLCREQMREAIEDTGARYHNDYEVQLELYQNRKPSLSFGIDNVFASFCFISS